MEQGIDALFGSKTRVKLLDLFYKNPNQSFYVREITRLIEEQVNSVRRELDNLQKAGVVKSTTEDRKLFYKVNQRFKYYIPLRAIFAGVEISDNSPTVSDSSLANSWNDKIEKVLPKLDVLIVSGIFVDDAESNIDMVVVGDDSDKALSTWAAEIEANEGRQVNYSVMSMDDFYYRLSTKDIFLGGVLNSKHVVVVDKEELLN